MTPRDPCGILQAMRVCLLLMSLLLTACRPSTERGAFTCVVLGGSGGLAEDDLTAILLAPRGSSAFVALDAGTLHSGIRKALHRGAFKDIRTADDLELTAEGQILRKHVHAYLLSHAHLDHVSGLILNSTDDAAKPIYGLPSTLSILSEHVFNWRTWPNFTTEGVNPLSRYTLTRMVPGAPQPIAGTLLQATAYPLSHGRNVESTAFLIKSEDAAVLYLGDTGPDAVEGGGHLSRLWKQVAPLIRDHQLRAIFLEASYPSDRPDALLFGHLTPAWIRKELATLARTVDADDPDDALTGVKVVVTHIKPVLTRGEDPRARIERELTEEANGATFIVPRQGDRLAL